MDLFFSRMGLVWLVYFTLAGLSSLLPSRRSDCILVGENADQWPDFACASVHEGVWRFVRLLWEHADHDNVVALGTIFIAVFTYTLWQSTNKLWEAGEAQRRLTATIARQQANQINRQLDIALESAEASKQLAAAAVGSGRARLYVSFHHNFLEGIGHPGAWDGPRGQEERPCRPQNSQWPGSGSRTSVDRLPSFKR